MNRFHLDHKYFVGPCHSSTPTKKSIVDVSKIGVLGQDKAIDEIMWSVFRPRKFSLKVRREYSKFNFDWLYNVVLNRYADLELVRGIVLYGPPGTGKTSMIRCVSIKFLSFFIYFYTLGAYASI